ncbi:hypothetical protein HBP72_11710 [Listeria welshimeri]|nr:hypothetical protein [Listeria welshimeri]MBC1344728.1 hypothetical protein [Listeria welshimeri]MBC1362423.1 hypothetical protein [Listeria welshimeri]MBC1369425.1 hypothetical protein [Listeria welshimeri]MBC1391507.1 hypothetical protein [Listeria welshimeri]
MKINKIIEYIVVATIVLGWTYLIVIKEILPKNLGFISLVILSIVLYFIGKWLNGKKNRKKN